MCRHSISKDIYLCDDEVEKPAQLMPVADCGGCGTDNGQDPVCRVHGIDKEEGSM